MKHIGSGSISLRSVAIYTTPYDKSHHDYQSLCETDILSPLIYLFFLVVQTFIMTSRKPATLKQTNKSKALCLPLCELIPNASLSSARVFKALRHQLILITMSASSLQNRLMQIRNSICIPFQSNFPAHNISMDLWQRPKCCQHVVYALSSVFGLFFFSTLTFWAQHLISEEVKNTFFSFFFLVIFPSVPSVAVSQLMRFTALWGFHTIRGG